MTRNLMLLAIVLALTLVPGTTLRAQQQAEAPGLTDSVALSVEVTISRYLGDELVSRRPYVLAVTARERSHGPVASLRVGGNVPLLTPMIGPVVADGEPMPRTIANQLVRVAIECSARTLGDGRHETTVSIEELSIGGEEQPSAGTLRARGTPFVRDFSSENTLVLRDGQSRQYLAAADPVSGETVRVDVTLTVVD